MGEYAKYGFDEQLGWYGMFVACGIWCLADVSSVSPSSERLNIHAFFLSTILEQRGSISPKIKNNRGSASDSNVSERFYWKTQHITPLHCGISLHVLLQLETLSEQIREEN